eukprot:COSAG01_NODE_3715_length_5769_cov_2.903175_4_plen_93_part_00
MQARLRHAGKSQSLVTRGRYHNLGRASALAHRRARALSRQEAEDRQYHLRSTSMATGTLDRLRIPYVFERAAPPNHNDHHRHSRLAENSLRV